MQTGRSRGRRYQRIGDFHTVRAGISREVSTRLSSHAPVHRDLTAGFEERSSRLLFPGSDSGVHLGPRNGGAKGRGPGVLQSDRGLEHAGMPPQDFDDDVGIQEDARQLREVRAFRVSRRSRLTYAALSPTSSRSRHNPAIPRSVARRSAV